MPGRTGLGWTHSLLFHAAPSHFVALPSQGWPPRPTRSIFLSQHFLPPAFISAIASPVYNCGPPRLAPPRLLIGTPSRGEGGGIPRVGRAGPWQGPGRVGPPTRMICFPRLSEGSIKFVPRPPRDNGWGEQGPTALAEGALPGRKSSRHVRRGASVSHCPSGQPWQ